MKRQLAEHYSQVPDRIYRDPSMKGALRDVLVNVVGHILPGDHYAMKLEQIAGEIGYVRSTVASAVDELERRQFLVVERRVEHGKQQASVFRIGPAWWDATAEGSLSESDHRTRKRRTRRTQPSPIDESDRVRFTDEAESDNRTAKEVDPRAVDPRAVDPLSPAPSSPTTAEKETTPTPGRIRPRGTTAKDLLRDEVTDGPEPLAEDSSSSRQTVEPSASSTGRVRAREAEDFFANREGAAYPFEKQISPLALSGYGELTAYLETVTGAEVRRIFVALRERIEDLGVEGVRQEVTAWHAMVAEEHEVEPRSDRRDRFEESERSQEWATTRA